MHTPEINRLSLLRASHMLIWILIELVLSVVSVLTRQFG